MDKTIRSRRVRACVAMTSLSLLLPGCGGGSDAANTGGAVLGPTSRTVSETPQTAASPPVAPADTPTTAPEAPGAGVVGTVPQVVDSSRTGQRLVKAVGALDDGGHVVVWLSREPGDTTPAWPLWAQRFDAAGNKTGPAVRLAYPDDVYGPDDVAVTVLPEGRIGVTFLTRRDENDAFAITEVHHWPYTLAGTIDGMVRVIDARPYARFSPRFDRLAGPLSAVAGADGSHYVSWRFQIVGAAPLAPSVRALRLAADGQPLGWIQRLDGEGFSRVFDVRVTALDEGGWVVGEERVSPAGVRYRTFTQLDIARPLGMPQDEPQASDAFLLDLRGHGSVLFTRSINLDTGEFGPARRIHFDNRGRADPAREFSTMPGAAVALKGGDYITFESRHLVVVAQRYTPAGDPVGPAFETAALSGPIVSASLRPGGAAIARVTTTTDGEAQILSQRLLAPSQP